MYLTFSEGPLQSLLCPKAMGNGDFGSPPNLSNWVLVGSSSPNVAVHIRLKFECSIVDVDKLPKAAIEWTTSTLRGADSQAPIHWMLVQKYLQTQE